MSQIKPLRKLGYSPEEGNEHPFSNILYFKNKVHCPLQFDKAKYMQELKCLDTHAAIIRQPD